MQCIIQQKYTNNFAAEIFKGKIQMSNFTNYVEVSLLE